MARQVVEAAMNATHDAYTWGLPDSPEDWR